MGSHKNRLKTKKYKKVQIRLKRQYNRRNFRIFSPDLIYLNSKFSTRLKKLFLNNLFEKKKLKLLFNFNNILSLKNSLQTEFSKNSCSRFVSKELEFCSLLERRPDFVIHRLGLVSTFFEAKQLISYKYMNINDSFNTGFSYLLKRGDIISFHPFAKQKIKRCLRDQIKKVPFYLCKPYNIEINFQTLKIVVLTEKFNTSRQMFNYLLLLNWRAFMNK